MATPPPRGAVNNDNPITPSSNPNTASASCPAVSATNATASATAATKDNYKKVREVGNQATWSVSSCKPGKTTFLFLLLLKLLIFHL